MAQHKTPYGLVYNDDGSLCVTVREDDVPFPGVRSFAVEEGTTNLYDPDAYAAVSGAIFTRTKLSSGPLPFTGHQYKVVVTQTGTSGNLIKFGYLDIADGETVTYSIYFLSQNGLFKPKVYSPGIASFWMEEKEGHRWIFTYTNDTGGTVSMMMFIDHIDASISDPSPTNDVIYYGGVQAEKKPFATSFVDGSRNAGSLMFFDDGTIRSWADDGVVIAGWWKFNYWSDDRKFRVFSCTENGGFNIEKIPGYNIRLVINDGGTYIVSYLQNPDIFADLKWHFVVFYYRPDTKVAKVYVDAVEQASVSLSSGLYFSSDKYYSLMIGAELNGSTNPPTVDVTRSGGSILVSNLFVGKLFDSIGNFVWKESYIQQLYQAKRPFETPLRIPIL